jgi:hypothetical protein
MFPNMPTYSLQRSLDSFFAGDDQVLVIKGAWGVGKTYFWDKYIETRIKKKDLKQIAYSYVSLFGKASLADIRASVFQSAKSIATNENIERKFDEELESSTSLLRLTPWVREATEKARGKAPIIGWLTNLARSTPFTDKYSGIIASLEYGLVKDYIICFDDLERKGASLSIREVMGLADELARRKSCKVVLIFNDNSFSDEKDKREFEAYREKVVDAELDYGPTHKQNLACSLPIEHPLFIRIEPLIEILDLKNIRVLKKLIRLIDAFWPDLEKSDEWIFDEFTNHATILCWSYYMRDTALPFSFIKTKLEEGPWGSYFNSKKDEVPPEEKRYRTITSAITLLPSTFDKHIIHFLERGYANTEEVRAEIAELSKKVDVQRAHDELSQVWNRYTDTFAENQSEIISQFKSVLDRHADKIRVGEFSAALDMLAEFGEDVTPYIDHYIELHSATLASMDRHDFTISRRISYKPLLDRIKDVQAARSSFDIDQVAMKIAVNQGWNPEDIDFLVSISADEFYEWIKGEPVDLPTKLRGGLLFFGNLQGGNPEDTKKYLKIYENVTAAMRRLASDSPLNIRRLKTMYDINAET